MPKATLAPQTTLEPGHLASVGLVVVAEQVKKAVQREHTQLGRLGMPRFGSLTPSDATRDDDIAQKNWKDSRFVISAGGKAQDVGHGVAPAIPPVERPHPAIRDDRNVDGPTRLGRCDPDQPRSQTARSQTPSLIV